MPSNKKDLRAYVRIDGSGRVVAGSLVLRRKKPKVGKWMEIPAYECCNGTTTSTTTPTPFYIFELAADNSAANACASLPTTETYYSDINDIGIGTFLYLDSSLTTPVPDGWYASPFSGFAYEVMTGDGMINNAAPC